MYRQKPDMSGMLPLISAFHRVRCVGDRQSSVTQHGSICARLARSAFDRSTAMNAAPDVRACVARAPFWRSPTSATRCCRQSDRLRGERKGAWPDESSYCRQPRRVDKAAGARRGLNMICPHGFGYAAWNCGVDEGSGARRCQRCRISHAPSCARHPADPRRKKSALRNGSATAAIPHVDPASPSPANMPVRPTAY